MLDTRDPRDPWSSSDVPSPPHGENQRFLDWLETGRLTLVGADKRPLPAEAWPDLPSDIRARALADFRRVVSANAKAAVIFLRP